MTHATHALLGMSAERFLREHWQKKPLLVRGAMPDLRDPRSPEELAGLACEDGVESRIVRERGGSAPWEVTWGPHPESRFGTLPGKGWTLLVQELNRHVPAAALLLEPFAFLPNVRVDDVMVSYAAPGGSVGPHLDSYDVFLVQGMGSRRWLYNTRETKNARFRKGLDLRILEPRSFRPDADEVLERGDLLYLPPGFAHHGVAVTPCLTYSIGFRAPAFGEMWKAFASHVAAQHGSGAARLIVDPPLAPAANPGAIPPGLLARVRDAIRGLPHDDDAIDRFFAAFATRLALGHELTAPRTPPTATAMMTRLRRGDRLTRSEEGRWAYLPRPRGALLLYVGGVELEVAAPAADLARALCAARRFDGRELAALAEKAPARALLLRLISLGALAFAAVSGRRATARSRSSG